MGIIAILGSDQLIKEARRTVSVCFNIIADFPAHGTIYEERVKRELSLLAERAANAHPRISAANFFDLNQNIFFSFLISSTTYAIIIMQLNNFM